MEQLKTLGRELAMGSHGGTWVGGQSKEFLDIVKSIGEARSKAEEDRIVLSEIETLKLRLTEPDIPKRKMKEYMIRLVYVEMLGHDASFGYIHAVKMTHDDSLLLKRTGYLAVTLFLREDHDLIILIINTIQKDLKSDNYLVVCAALTAVCKLINEETIPAVLPQVVELIGHPKEAVRKKAIMALHRFHQRSAYAVAHLVSNFRKRLCDNDPGVMGATLCPLFDIITVDTNSFKDLLASFVNILKQVAERRLSRSYDYHQMPAPFIQIKLLKILSLLGSGDKQASESMYNVVGEVFRKCDSSSNIGNAVLYECICCISSIYPNAKLLKTAAEAISRFLKSDSHNLKYMGIDALGRLIKISPEYAEKHQLAVIDCLEDPDDTLKRKTFELLYKMTKFSNVEVIVDRMIEYMVNISDDHYKREIASRCVELAEQFAPHNNWFIQTMNKVFQHAGDLVNIKVAHNLMSLIAEGSGEDEDTHLRSFAVESYLHIIGEPKLPSTFLQVICWVLGEYGTTDGKFSASFISGKLCDLAEGHATDDTVKAYAVTALMKIYAFELASGRKVNMLPECESFIEELSASHSTDLQQRAYELQALVGLDGSAVKEILPFHSSGMDIEIDKGLSFLDSYVRESIEKGAQPYNPEDKRSNAVNMHNIQTRDLHESSMHTLRFEAYELPKPLVPLEVLPSSTTSTSNVIPLSELSSPPEVHEAPSSSNQPGIRLRLDGIQKKWGRTSYSPSEVSVSNPKTTNGILPAQGPGSAGTRPKESRFSEPEMPSEKQKLAASLFGGTSKSQERKPQAEKKKSGFQPPPDLLDLGDPIVPENSRPVDPFIQLEGLLDVEAPPGAADVPDVMSIYNFEGLGACVNSGGGGGQKGPNAENSLARDAVARQAGVIPSGQNPNLFKDLLG